MATQQPDHVTTAPSPVAMLRHSLDLLGEGKKNLHARTALRRLWQFTPEAKAGEGAKVALADRGGLRHFHSHRVSIRSCLAWPCSQATKPLFASFSFVFFTDV